jgi:H+/Cl- antiporter ClcA
MNWVKNNILNYLLKFTILSVVIGFYIGTATAIFLLSLEVVTNYRANHHLIIFSLPIFGLIIGWMYYKYGTAAKKGNNLIIEQHSAAKKETIPFIMAPLVFITTLLTHLAGGSAGREGTAVQMGGAMADQFTKSFKLDKEGRNNLLIMGVSAGFAAVFGTPFAGAVFALEIMLFKNCKWQDIGPSFASAYFADYFCTHWGISWGIYHTNYAVYFSGINFENLITLKNIAWAMLAGVFFGFAAFLFSGLHKILSKIFSKIKHEPLRPFIGGIILVIVIVLLGNSTGIEPFKFIGLGIESITASFQNPADNYDFLIKILLTTFTLSAGFKGGEVTPLFFIGATLGSVLIWLIPLPMALLAGMGFVAVFAGATHAGITGIVLGIELFGMSAGFFVGVASILAYFTSGIEGIYSAQLKEGAKYKLYNYFKSISKL